MADKRLSDLCHVDELSRMRDRMFGLHEALTGDGLPNGPARSGIVQLSDDICKMMTTCATAFETERQYRIADAGGARG